jgi:ankyrin repeat protein
MANRSLRTFNRGLLLTAEQGDLESLRKMLDEGTDVDTRGKDGWTGLMMAAAFGKTEAFQFRPDCGTEILAELRRGTSRLWWD